MAILGATLVLFAFGLLFANQARLAAGLDTDLRERTVRSRPPFGFGGGPGGPGGPGRGPGPGQGRRQPFDQPMQGEPLAGPPPENDLPQGMDAESFRSVDLRRPRQFDRELKTLSRPTDRPMDLQAAQSVLRSGVPMFSYGVFDGQKVRIFTMPWRDGDQVVGIAQVARETKDLDDLWRSQMVTLAIFLPCALVAAALGALFLTNRAMRPIAAMQASASNIGEDNLQERIDVQGEDEFAELGHTFNGMVGRLETSFNDLKDALENQKRFTADASHELRTPLTRLKLATSSALEATASAEDRLIALQSADKAAESMTRLVQQLLLLAKADSGQLAFQRERADLRIVASEAIEAVLLPPDAELHTEFPEQAVYAEIDTDAVRRVIANLLENAYRYAGKGCVTVGISEAEGEAKVSVSDTGPGIAPEHLPHLGERFYRTDFSRNLNTGGSGLGLSICKTIVEGHGGHLNIESRPGQGTTVVAFFPKTYRQAPNQTTSS